MDIACRMKMLGTSAAASFAGVLATMPHVFAADAADAGKYSSVDTIWVLLGAALVFFMQPGFAMVETGLTRAKNAGNIVMKNLMDLCIGTIAFWIVSFGLMFGDDIGGIIGTPDFFIQVFDPGPDAGYPALAYVIFQTVFCATSATIVSGAMAERTKFSTYCFYSLLISLIIYPVSGHWAWGGGWLSEMGFHDFAGSTVVPMVGGICAFIGAFILWFGWFGFNGCSTVSMTGDDTLISTGSIFVTTNLAAATAATATMCFTWIRYGHPDVSMTLNGALAGLVAITAGCDAVSPAGSFAIGLIAGIVVVLAVEFIDQKLKVDDPVGAVAVHGVCGALGTILTGVFAVDGGLLYAGTADMLITQIIGVVSVAIYVAVMITIVFTVLKHTIGLRVSAKEETAGLDFEEHGLASAYADFMPVPEVTGSTSAPTPIDSTEPPTPVTVTQMAQPAVDAAGHVLTCLSILTARDRFEPLKIALESIGITGMTVTPVSGYGLQKGHAEMYRGAKVASKLVPKIQVKLVVSAIPPEKIVAVAKKVLHTGHYGDGKIFITPVTNVVKIRTGAEGFAALQATPE